MANNEYMPKKKSRIFALLSVSIIFDIVHDLGFLKHNVLCGNRCHRV